MRFSTELNGCVVASKDDVRRYLEQRIELGETSLVLESPIPSPITLPRKALTTDDADDADNRVSQRLSASSASSVVNAPGPTPASSVVNARGPTPASSVVNAPGPTPASSVVNASGAPSTMP